RRGGWVVWGWEGERGVEVEVPSGRLGDVQPLQRGLDGRDVLGEIPERDRLELPVRRDGAPAEPAPERADDGGELGGVAVLRLEDPTRETLLGDERLFLGSLGGLGSGRGLGKSGLCDGSGEKEGREGETGGVHETSCLGLEGSAEGFSSPFRTSQMMQTLGFAVRNSIRSTSESAFGRRAGRRGPSAAAAMETGAEGRGDSIS